MLYVRYDAYFKKISQRDLMNVTWAWPSQFSSQTLNRSSIVSVSVENFFVISGLLACYTLLKQLQRNKGKLNLMKHYIHRYMRCDLYHIKFANDLY